jgi:hypothetical protein
MPQTEFLWTRDTSIELAILSLILVKQMDSVLLKLVIQAQHTTEVLLGRKYSWDIVRYEMLLKVHTAETNSTHHTIKEQVICGGLSLYNNRSIYTSSYMSPPSSVILHVRCKTPLKPRFNLKYMQSNLNMYWVPIQHMDIFAIYP